MDEKLTQDEIRVLQNLQRGVTPETLNEFDIYVSLRDRGLAGYDDATKTAQPTKKGGQLMTTQQVQL